MKWPVPRSKIFTDCSLLSLYSCFSIWLLILFCSRSSGVLLQPPIVKTWLGKLDKHTALPATRRMYLCEQWNSSGKGRCVVPTKIHNFLSLHSSLRQIIGKVFLKHDISKSKSNSTKYSTPLCYQLSEVQQREHTNVPFLSTLWNRIPVTTCVDLSHWYGVFLFFIHGFFLQKFVANNNLCKTFKTLRQRRSHLQRVNSSLDAPGGGVQNPSHRIIPVWGGGVPPFANCFLSDKIS